MFCLSWSAVFSRSKYALVCCCRRKLLSSYLLHLLTVYYICPFTEEPVSHLSCSGLKCDFLKLNDNRIFWPMTQSLPRQITTCRVVCRKHRGLEEFPRWPYMAGLCLHGHRGQLLWLLLLPDSWAIHQPAHITVIHRHMQHNTHILVVPICWAAWWIFLVRV